MRTLMRRLIAAFALCLAGAAPLFGQAEPHALPLIVDPSFSVQSLGKYVNVLEDPGGGLTIDDVRAPSIAARFIPSSTEEPNFGYTKSAWWLCFTLRSRDGVARDLLLEVRFPSIDRIEVYAQGADGLTIQHGGDSRPFDTRAIPHRNHVFAVSVPANGEVTVFLRTASESVLTVPMKLWTPEAFNAADRDSQLQLGAFYGLIFALFFYNLMLYLSLRDRAYLAYVAYVAAFGVYLLSFDGLAFQYLWPQSTYLANHALATALSLTVVFGIAFARIFLDLRRVAPLADRALAWLMGTAGVLAFCAATGIALDYGTVLRTLSLLGFFGAALVLGAAVRCLMNGFRPARFFLLAWSALLVFIVLGALRNFALVPSTFLTVYGLHIGLVLDILLLSFALADRIRSLKRETEQVQSRLAESQQSLVAVAHESARLLETRIVERTDELNHINEQLRKEAGEREHLMRQLRDREEHLRFMAQHDPLTGLPNRISLQQRLELATQLAKRNRRRLAVMMVDLDDFKQLNDTRGHLVGDQALAAVGARLRTSVRGSDTVARYGGDEFVVLTGELDRIEDAAMIAEKIADTVNVPLAVDGGMARVGCSIGIAIFPDDAEGVEALIELADKAMYAAKADKTRRFAYYAPA